MSGDVHELSIERLIDAPVEAVWRAYTDHLDEWFCPKPWRAEVEVMDLRAGGQSKLVMYGPNGEVMPNDGVYLEVVPQQKIVFTDAFRSGWIPQGPFMVGFMEFTAQGAQTHYRGGARHWTAEAMEQHKAMGFEAGWSEVAAQLETVAKRLAETTDA
jgi:uncharacterized protein YndB with AHSA1/START domain